MFSSLTMAVPKATGLSVEEAVLDSDLILTSCGKTDGPGTEITELGTTVGIMDAADGVVWWGLLGEECRDGRIGRLGKIGKYVTGAFGMPTG